MEKTLEGSKVDFISKVMGNMGAGLFITFITAFFVSQSAAMQSIIYGSSFTIILLFIAELALVVYITRRIGSMSFSQARLYFFVYSAITGITFSSIFIAYDATSICSVFLIAALMFVISGLIGISIKKDLSAMGHFFMLALIGIIVLSIVSIFLPGLNFIVSALGVALFSGLTAYDMQKIKAIHYNAYSMSSEIVSKYSIIGALTLYLDFINLFLFLLRIFGKRR
jgi:FtsH-binding integral membrane protein